MRSASARVVAIGFSHRIARAPASAACTHRSAWAWSEVAMLTRSASSRAIIPEKSV